MAVGVTHVSSIAVFSPAVWTKNQIQLRPCNPRVRCAFHPCKCDDESCRSTLMSVFSFSVSCCCCGAVHGVPCGLKGNGGGGCCRSVALRVTGRGLDSGPKPPCVQFLLRRCESVRPCGEQQLSQSVTSPESWGRCKTKWDGWMSNAALISLWQHTVSLVGF